MSSKSSSLEKAITLARGFARGLNPVRLEAHGLMVALAELAVNVEKLFGIACHFEYTHSPLSYTTMPWRCIYRIVQSGLNNPPKHGKVGSSGSCLLPYLPICSKAVFVKNTDGNRGNNARKKPAPLLLILRTKKPTFIKMCFNYTLRFIAFYIAFSIYREYAIKKLEIAVLGEFQAKRGSTE